jgi:hypothetical protein
MIKDLMAEGRSLDEIRAAVGDRPLAPGQPAANFPTFTQVVYEELTQKG